MQMMRTPWTTVFEGRWYVQEHGEETEEGTYISVRDLDKSDAPVVARGFVQERTSSAVSELVKSQAS